MKFEVSGPVKIVSSEDGQWDGFIVPETNDQLCVVTRDTEDGMPPAIYWSFFATASGVEIYIWEERPEVKASLPKWKQDEGEHYLVTDVHSALRDGKELYDAAVEAGIPFHCTDEAEVKAALSKVDFIVIDNHQPVLCRRYSQPKPKKRVTQKILDGGQDMTIKN